MKHFLFLVLTFCFFQSKTFAQTDSSKLRKLDLTDAFEQIIYYENKRLDTLMIKTEIWVSDYTATQYDNNLGIIINRAKLIQAIKKDNNVNKSFLIRLILAHEKMHAKHAQIFKNWKWYITNVHQEQLLLDEVQADMAAGYVAFQFNNKEDAKFNINIIKAMEKSGLEEEPNISKEDLFFGEKLKKDEQAAFDLFLTLGDNQSHISKYPNSYQRQLAFELGAKAYSIRNLNAEIKLQKNKHPTSTLQLLHSIVKQLENNINYQDINTKEYDYFYNSWSYWMSRRIIHFPNSLNKFITFQLIGGKESDSTSYYAKIITSICNKNKLDSIKITYSILMKGMPEDKSVGYKNDMIMCATHSSVILAPNETKIVTDSILDMSEVLKGYSRLRLIFPGQFGSLYYTELENEKYANGKKYLSARDDSKKINLETFNLDEGTIEDLLKDLNSIQKDFNRSNIDDYKIGVGFQNINEDEISYSTFILNRPFELLVTPSSNKAFLRTTVFQDLNIKTVENYLKKIKNILETNDKYKVVYNSGVEKYDNIDLISDNGKTACRLSIIFNELYNEYHVELEIYKTFL